MTNPEKTKRTRKIRRAKRILYSFVPPVLSTLPQAIRSATKNPDTLFDGDDSLYKKVLRDAVIYGEYGCGASTGWVLKNTSAKVLAVDTSKRWVRKVLNRNNDNRERLDIKHTDFGDVGPGDVLRIIVSGPFSTPIQIVYGSRLTNRVVCLLMAGLGFAVF